MMRSSQLTPRPVPRSRSAPALVAGAPDPFIGTMSTPQLAARSELPSTEETPGRRDFELRKKLEDDEWWRDHWLRVDEAAGGDGWQTPIVPKPKGEGPRKKKPRPWQGAAIAAGPVPPGAVRARTAGGRVATVLYRKQRGYFAVELDGDENDEGGAYERKTLRRPKFAPGQDELLNSAPPDPNRAEPKPRDPDSRKKYPNEMDPDELKAHEKAMADKKAAGVDEFKAAVKAFEASSWVEKDGHLKIVGEVKSWVDRGGSATTAAGWIRRLISKKDRLRPWQLRCSYSRTPPGPPGGVVWDIAPRKKAKVESEPVFESDDDVDDDVVDADEVMPQPKKRGPPRARKAL